MLGAAVAGGAGLAVRGLLPEEAAGVGPVPTDGLLPRSRLAPLIFQSPRVRPFVEELAPMAVHRGENFTLDAATHTHRFHPEYEPSPSFGYGGASYLSPVLEVERDTPVTLTFRNRIGANVFAKDVDPTLHGASESDRTRVRSVLHLHGGVQPSRDDGHPEATILPGERFVHRFPMRQRAANIWFHDHALGITRLNAYAGLAGMMWIRDRWDTGRRDNPLGLPSGRHEMPLVLQEKIFTGNGRQSVRSTPLVPQGSWEGGAVGDVGLVNGQVWPRIPVDRGVYRFRVINAASFSGWHLYFSNRMPFWVIGNDGGLLDAPVRVRSVRLAPAERLDVLVDFGRLDHGDRVHLCNDEVPPNQAKVIGEVAMPVFCRFDVGGARGPVRTIPSRLRGGRGRPARLPVVRRPARARNLTINQLVEMRLPPAMMSLNNLTFASSDIEMPRQGTTEVWNLINVTRDPHPIHLHLVNFRVLGRQPIDVSAYKRAHPVPALETKWNPSADPYVTGPMVASPAYERGWKDTVRATPKSITRIVVHFPTADALGFDPDASFLPPHPPASDSMEMDGMSGMSGMDAMDMSTGAAPRRLRGYMWHCHLLDHEDHDMMLGYRTVAR